jgi:predicted ABC-type ATPase
VISPELVILAGPNGAGKTTFARHNLGTLIDQDAFLNADEIARDVNPSNVEAVAIEAGRAAIARRAEFLLRRQDFCIETTLATRTLLRFLHQAKAAGYRINLVFLFTPLPYLNELRVKQRVMSGGHNIETDTIRRRHKIGLELLASYWDAVDEAVVFDARTRQPVEIVRKELAGTFVHDDAALKLLNEAIAAAGGRPFASP